MMDSFHTRPDWIRTATDINTAIRTTWENVCKEFPNATTPMIAKKVAEDYSISVERVFEAFNLTGGK